MKMMMDDDEDVVMEGSALYDHLKESGFGEDLEIDFKSKKDIWTEEQEQPKIVSGSGAEANFLSRMLDVEYESRHQRLVLNAVGKVLDSNILVSEDEDFLKEFFIAGHGQKEPRNIPLVHATKFLALLGSGILCYFKPSSARVFIPSMLLWNAYKHYSCFENVFLRNLQQFLDSTNLLQSSLSKSINFIKGMEMVNHFFKSKSKSKMSSQELNFSNLRSGIRVRSIESIEEMRKATRSLITHLPLLEEFESSNYFANVSLENFGIVGGESETEDRLTVSKLKETNNLFLLLTSEFLRRACLSLRKDIRKDFSFKEDISIISNILKTLNEKIECSLERINKLLLFSQAQGCINQNIEENLKESSLKSQKSHNINIANACLHLQTCLIKLRSLQSPDASEVSVSSNSSNHLGEIIEEVKLCLELLEDSADSMKKILNPNLEIPKLESEAGARDTTNPHPAQIIDETMEIQHDDEVFVAVIRKDEDSQNCKDENCDEFEEEKKQLKESKQTKRVLRELKTVLIEKEQDWKERERKAIARMNGQDIHLECGQIQEENSNTATINNKEYVCEENSHCSSYEDERGTQEKEDHQLPHDLLNNQALFKRPRKPVTARRSKDSLKLQSTGFQLDFAHPKTDMEENTKTDKEGRIITINRQPLGFDSRLDVNEIMSN